MPKDESTNELAESLLLEILEKSPEDWTTRKKLAQLLYNEGKTSYAADIVWDAPEIPPIDLELGFAIKVLSKGAPRRAIRLITFIQENNEGKHVQNLGIANALMHYGLVLQAARFYGAAIAGDSSLASADLEHFLLWVDDTEKIWGNFADEKPDIGELPWMKRDDKEAANLKKAMMGHTTPVRIPNLQEVSSEKIVHDLYEQSNKLHSKITPPPAVSIPIEQVNKKDIVFDDDKGAAQPVSVEQAAKEKAAQLKANPVGSIGQPLPPVAAASAPTILTPKPLVSEPSILEPEVAAPVIPAPITPRPMNDASPIADSLLSQPNNSLPEIPEPAASSPFAIDPDASTPVALSPFATEPAASLPEIPEPAISGPMITAPKLSLPQMPEPVSSPFATEPAASLPEIPEPAISGPMIGAPKLSLPQMPKPVSSPFATEPAASLPEIPEPAISGPMITAPKLSLPKLPDPDSDPSPFKY